MNCSNLTLIEFNAIRFGQLEWVNNERAVNIFVRLKIQSLQLVLSVTELFIFSISENVAYLNLQIKDYMPACINLTIAYLSRS